MKRNLFVFLTLGLFFVALDSCQNRDMAYGEESTEVEKRVTFVPSSETRATDNAFEAGDVIGVFATTNERGEILPSGNYASNEKYTFSGGKFIPVGDGIPVYHGDIYSINYYAIYPYQANQSVSFTFTVGEDQSTHANYTKNDLMMGYNAASTTDALVSLKFRHILGQVVIKTSHAGLEGRNCTLLFLSDINKVNANLAKLTALRTEGGTRPIDVIMCPDGLNQYKAVVPPQKMVANSVMAYLRIDGTTYLARLEKDANLHSGRSIVFDLYPKDDANEYILKQIDN